MTALEEYRERSRKAINKEDTRAVYVYDMDTYNIDGYFEIKDSLLELQGYRKAYNRLLEEKRKLSEKVKKNEGKRYYLKKFNGEGRCLLIDKDELALEVISNVIDDIELNIELSKVVE